MNNHPKVEDIVHDLAEIRQQIERLKLPKLAYAGLEFSRDRYCLAIIDGDRTLTTQCITGEHDMGSEIIRWFTRYAADHDIKIIAAGIIANSHHQLLASKFWLKEDIMPFRGEREGETEEERSLAAARSVSHHFHSDSSSKARLTLQNEVIVSELVTLTDYQPTVTPALWQEVQAHAKTFQQNKHSFLFFSSTPQGGGVALMRHSLVHFLNLLGVDTHWHVLTPRKDIFEITKGKFHNILQGVAPEDIHLTRSDQEAYHAWIEENTSEFADVIAAASVIVIDDPQPSGLIPHIKRLNPASKIIYRSHIHLLSKAAAQPGTPQNTTWSFLWESIKQADLFISHPVTDFIPANLPPQQSVTMPAATDLLDGLNKPLTRQQQSYYLKWFNKILLEHHQTPLDPSRPYIIQIARFDPSKGITDVIESYRLLREKIDNQPQYPTPQLVIAGHGSVDDPDGVPIYSLTMDLLQQNGYYHLAHDVKVARLPHNDQILNALLRGSAIALQLSHKEGFEVKVTEALVKGKPTVAYNTGGIPLQIENEVTGYLVDVGSCEQVAEHLYTLLTDHQQYQRISRQARSRINQEFFTVSNAANWLFLANQLLAKNKIIGNGQSVKKLREGSR